jgi:hypothetical protein
MIEDGDDVRRNQDGRSPSFFSERKKEEGRANQLARPMTRTKNQTATKPVGAIQCQA